MKNSTIGRINQSRVTLNTLSLKQICPLYLNGAREFVSNHFPGYNSYQAGRMHHCVCLGELKTNLPSIAKKYYRD